MSSSKSPKRPKGVPATPNDAASIEDPRFASFQTDPRYRLPSKRTTHVKLDKRFSHMLNDPDFTRKAKVDRYGRPIKADEKGKLKKFYEVEDENGVEGDDGGVDRASETETSSSSEEDSDLDAEEDAEAEAGLPDLEQGVEVPMGEDISRRLAVVNLDWDNIRAVDLMAVFQSFVQQGAAGKVLKVSVYPSEFGKERMEREEMEGPPKEIFKSKDALDATDGDDGENEEEDDDEEQGDEEIKREILQESTAEDFDSAKLRRYQLERLRFYYAVLECSSSAVAKAIYDAVDGTEYLTTANFFDLRFVPDETDFSDDTPRDECDTIPEGYKPSEFVTGALQHSNVKLTWDADDAVRKEAQAKAFKGGRKEIDENDLKAYLGSDSSDDEEKERVDNVDATKNTTAPDEPAAESTVPLSKRDRERQRTRQLLGLAAEPKKSKATATDKAPVGDLQITFSSGLSGSARPTGSSVFENTDETTVEKYVRKERERKQKRKERLKASRGGVDPDEDIAKEDDDAGAKTEGDLGFEDPFFKDQNFEAPQNDTAATKAMRKEERRKKREEREKEEAANAAQRAELELLMTDAQGAKGKHFDMDEIEKTEKKKGKKGKTAKKAGTQAVEEDDDDFNVDELQQDPRFAQLYDSHEFAIDPNNPRFRKTKGMKALLEKGRKRRDQGEELEVDHDRKQKRSKRG